MVVAVGSWYGMPLKKKEVLTGSEGNVGATSVNNGKGNWSLSQYHLHLPRQQRARSWQREAGHLQHSG